jgi:hypothetical protein
MSRSTSGWYRKVVGPFVVAALLTTLVPAGPAWAQRIDTEVEARLTPQQAAAYREHLRARVAHERQLDAYWDDVEGKREARKRKRSAGQAYTAADYVREQPPKYTGPPLPPDVGKIIASLKLPEPEAERRMGVGDFLANAKAHFGFVPAAPASEREFKRRYAAEALAAGLSKMQVVRIYALETGGRGTYDMQAGIDPDTRQGKPISSALGYAQLLNANSIDVLVRYGGTFVERLQAMAARSAENAQRAAALRAKALAVGRMQRAARSVPGVWSHHVRFSSTPRGLGIHALNLDADIGPWLQVMKLKDVLETAVKAGRTEPSGAELELMNLAGPRTGLEMMEPIGRAMPTTNFFSRTGYYRNTIVRERTGAELLAALDERMAVHLTKPGSLEFIDVFDEVMRERRAGR